MTKKLLIIGGLAAAFILATVVFLLAAGGGHPKAIRIAANLPLSGPLATYGQAVREGATMAIDDPSVENLTVDWQDNASDPKTAVSIFRKQMLTEPTIYVSGVKPQTMAIKDEVSDLGIPHFVWIFDAFINEKSNNNFRTWVSYKIEPAVYFDYIRSMNAKRVAITYVQLPHTIEEFEKILIPKLREAGVEIFVEPFDFGRNDFRDIAAKLHAFNPDVIILNGFQSELVGLVRSLRPLGTIKDGNTLATYDMLDAAKVLGPDEIDGIRVVAPVFETRPARPETAEWRNRFEKRYGREPLYTHAFAHDMITAIVAASKSLDHPASHEEWVRALRSVEAQGITGPIRFDRDGDLLTPIEVGVYRRGKLVPADPKEAPIGTGP